MRVVLAAGNWHAAPAAELLRPSLADIEIVRDQRERLREHFDRILLMAGSKADYLEAKLVNLVLGAVAFTAPANAFFGLWGAASSINDTFNGGTAGEVSGGSYARVSMTNNTTNFASVSGGSPTTKVNSTAITFATATANWNASANINQVGVLDGNAGTSGDNGLLWCDLTTPKPVLNGDQAQFAASAFSWTED